MNNSIKFETQTRFRNHSNGRNQDRVREKRAVKIPFLEFVNCLQNKRI